MKSMIFLTASSVFYATGFVIIGTIFFNPVLEPEFPSRIYLYLGLIVAGLAAGLLGTEKLAGFRKAKIWVQAIMVAHAVASGVFLPMDLMEGGPNIGLAALALLLYLFSSVISVWVAILLLVTVRARRSASRVGQA